MLRVLLHNDRHGEGGSNLHSPCYKASTLTNRLLCPSHRCINLKGSMHGPTIDVSASAYWLTEIQSWASTVREEGLQWPGEGSPGSQPKGVGVPDVTSVFIL